MTNSVFLVPSPECFSWAVYETHKSVKIAVVRAGFWGCKCVHVLLMLSLSKSREHFRAFSPHVPSMLSLTAAEPQKCCGWACGNLTVFCQRKLSGQSNALDLQRILKRTGKGSSSERPRGGSLPHDSPRRHTTWTVVTHKHTDSEQHLLCRLLFPVWRWASVPVVIDITTTCAFKPPTTHTPSPDGSLLNNQRWVCVSGRPFAREQVQHVTAGSSDEGEITNMQL